jgi:folate-binding protein YgfZ
MNFPLYHRAQAGEPVSVSLRDRAFWRMSGADRLRYLNGQITQDLSRLNSGHSLYAALTTPKGKMISDLFVHRQEDFLLLDAPLERREAVTARLEKYLIADDVVLEDITESRPGLHLISAAAPPVATALSHQARFGLPGWDLFDLTSPPVSSEPLLDDQTLEVIRVEHGLARWGPEMNENTLPPEAGLDRHGISYDKGCYVGQETIARIKSIGHVTKSLVLLHFAGGPSPVTGEALFQGEKKIGQITTVVASPQNPLWLALAYVQYPHHEPGQTVNTLNNSAAILELPSVS